MLRYLLAGLLLVAGCSSGEQMAVAQHGVDEFRELVQAGQFAKVYANSSDDLRKTVSEPDLAKILRGLSAKLGRVKVVQANGWNVNFHTSGTFVTLGFKTEFEKGAGNEQFVFRIVDGRALLVSYNVNSPALLAN